MYEAILSVSMFMAGNADRSKIIFCCLVWSNNADTSLSESFDLGLSQIIYFQIFRSIYIFL